MQEIITILLIPILLFSLPFLHFTEEENMAEKTETAILAGGCFWCLEHDLKDVEGIKEVISGYSGGKTKNPTYEDYSAGGHIEVVQVTFNPQEISYEELLNKFFPLINPTDGEGQFCDRGHSYISAIFYANNAQKETAEKVKSKVQELFEEEIKTEIIEFEKFWPAEDYHQEYSTKNPIRYKFYRLSCGRDSTTKEIWNGKNLETEFSTSHLTPIQYKVTQENGTEPAFQNEYWDNHEEGIYVDIVSGEPLFSSKDKFDSGTGWPSFTKPLEEENIVELEDNTLFMKRTEVRSKKADSHLGHIFLDGPLPTRIRYCMNSAALRFISKEDLKKEGYEEYEKLFE